MNEFLSPFPPYPTKKNSFFLSLSESEEFVEIKNILKTH